MPAPALFLSTGFTAAWSQVIQPWLDRASRECWRTERPWAVLTPTRASAALLKREWLASGRGLIATRFWTPGDVRDFLLSRLHPRPRVAVREHLHLLLASIAARSGDSPTARAIGRDPSRLLRTLDLLAATHADGPEPALANLTELPAEAQQIARDFLERLQSLDWSTVQQVDWQLAGQSQAGSMGPLLIHGFDALHWEQAPLLRAAVQSSTEATMVLQQPRFKAEQLDQIWIGTWEQAYGAATPLDAGDASGPFAPLAERMENADAVTIIPREAGVLVGRNLREQAEAVAQQCALWLAREPVTRLGVLLPGPGPLAREISARMLERGMLHYDALGHASSKEESVRRWEDWIAWQREQRLGTLLQWMRHEPDEGQLADALDEAYGETLSDDPRVLTGWLRGSRHPNHQAAASRLAAVRTLPASGTVSEYVEVVKQVLAESPWAAALGPILALQFDAISSIAGETVPRTAFLDWLAKNSQTNGINRSPLAADPYAKVQLLPHAAAEGQSWSHLILCGLNEGEWPPVFEQPGFLSETGIIGLNREAVTTGDQGEGHLTVKNGRLLMLGPAERRALARRQFYNLVEAPTHGLCVTAAMESDEDGRGLGPGDFLSHLYFTQSGVPLTETRIGLLHEATERWLENVPGPAGNVVSADSLAATLRAHRVRRDPRLPFGPHEFSCAKGPPTPLVIACKEWETVIASPAAVWMARVLGVEPTSDPLDGDRWPLTTGTWVHAWISHGLAARTSDRLVARPGADELMERTRSAARQTRDAVQQAYAYAARPLPDRWSAGWAQALWMSASMAESVGSISDWPWAATEWTLPRPTEVRLPGQPPLRLKGRMDLVLSHDDTFRPGSRLWLFDFKTGKDKPLSPRDLLKKFARGEGGLQLALYALALRTLGAADVQITLLTPYTPAAPQLAVADAESLAMFWAGLARMQETGIFGQRGSLRPEFGHAPDMPLATLAIPPDLLEEKWALTHPELVVDGD